MSKLFMASLNKPPPTADITFDHLHPALSLLVFDHLAPKPGPGPRPIPSEIKHLSSEAPEEKPCMRKENRLQGLRLVWLIGLD